MPVSRRPWNARSSCLSFGAGGAGWLPLLLFASACRDEPSDILREVRWRRADGTLRARGFVDDQGRRQGLWETWRSTGTRQSAIEFRSGEPHGLWRSFDREGELEEEGRMVSGLREGEWLNYHRHDGGVETERVTYVGGRERR